MPEFGVSASGFALEMNITRQHARTKIFHLLSMLHMKLDSFEASCFLEEQFWYIILITLLNFDNLAQSWMENLRHSVGVVSSQSHYRRILRR